MKKPALLFTSLAMGGALLLSACAPAAEDAVAASTVQSESLESTEESAAEQTASGTEEIVDVASLVEASYADLDVEEMDVSVAASQAVDVTVADGASEGGTGVSVDGDVVTITAAGVYRLSGTLTDGKVVVDAEGEDVQLILDGVDITSSVSGAIEVVAADQVALHLASGSSNAVSEAEGTVESTDDDGANAAIYSSADLFITGEGALAVTAVAADGITSKDSLVIDSGTITVEAADDGLRGKDHLVIRGGDVTVESGGDGLRADNVTDAEEPDKAVGVIWIEGGVIDVTSGADAIDSAVQTTIADGDLALDAEDDGIHSDGILRIDGGTVDVTRSYEGLEAAIMLLSDGEATVVSSDDGINVSDGSGGGEAGMGDDQMPGGDGARPGRPGEQTQGGAAVDATSASVVSTTADGTGARLEVSGGTWVVDADGDGLDANGSVTMTAGTVVIAGPTESMNGALDYDGVFTIDGGVLVASGSAGMAMSPSGGEQAVLGISLGQTLAAGQTVALLDADGQMAVAYTVTKDSQTLVLSSPALAAGDTYTVVIDGEVTGSGTAGLVTDGAVSGGETAGTVEAS